MTQLFSDVTKLAPKLSGDLKINRKKQAVNDLVANLFDTVRMSEWEYRDPENAFKFSLNKKLALWLTPASVEVRKGLRVFPIGNGKDAERLFNNIKHAKAVIAKAVAEQDKQVEAFAEAFDLDAALADDSTVSADSTKVDIKIKPAPIRIAPEETSPESEAAATLLTDEDKEVVLEKIGEAETAIKALQDTLGIDDTDLDSDIFSEALNAVPQKDTVGQFFELDDNGPQSPKRSLTADRVAEDAKKSLQSLQGRVLGIVDAAIADKEQRAAVKTLMNKEFRRELNKF